MAQKIKLTRPELKRRRDRLARFERYLPMLKLKQQQLQMTLREVAAQVQRAQQALDEVAAKLSRYRSVLADRAGIPLEQWSRPERVRTSHRNIAGVEVPVFEDVEFPAARYSLFGTPAWVDQTLTDLRQQSRRQAEYDVVREVESAVAGRVGPRHSARQSVREDHDSAGSRGHSPDPHQARRRDGGGRGASQDCQGQIGQGPGRRAAGRRGRRTVGGERMIVPMVKVYVAARCRDRERLLEAIRELGVIHLVPADPAQALADGPTAEAIQALQRAHQVLYGIKPQGNRLDLPAVEVAREVLNVERHTVENGNRLALLHHELDQLELWGNVRLQQIEGLRQAGIEVGFYAVADHDVASVRADCVAVVGELPDGRTVVAVAVRGGSLELPDGAAALPLPPRDAPSIRDEAAQIDAALKAGHRRLARAGPSGPGDARRVGAAGTAGRVYSGSAGRRGQRPVVRRPGLAAGRTGAALARGPGPGRTFPRPCIGWSRPTTSSRQP